METSFYMMMNSLNSRKIFTLLIFSVLIFLNSSCRQQPAADADPMGKAATPTEAYVMLYNAVRSKNTEAIRNMMSRASLKFVEGVAAQRKKPVAEILENGLYASTINPEMPEVRDERIRDGKYGAVEVFVKKSGQWEQAYFIKEDGGWKVAVGDLFAGTFKQPEPSQAQKQAQASNKMIPYRPNINGTAPPGNQNAENPAGANAKVKTIEVEPANRMAAPPAKSADPK